MLDPLKNAWLKYREARADAEQRGATGSQGSARPRIEKAADYLFSMYRPHVVTLEMVADRAETNMGYVLGCFGSLEGLYADHLQRLAEPQEELWKKLEELYPRRPNRQLRKWLQIVVPTGERRFDPLPLSPAAMELGYQPNHPAHIVIKNNKAALLSRLRALCRDDLRRDPDGLAVKLLILAEGALMHSMSFGSEGVADRLIEAADDLIARHA